MPKIEVCLLLKGPQFSTLYIEVAVVQFAQVRLVYYNVTKKILPPVSSVFRLPTPLHEAHAT